MMESIILYIVTYYDHGKSHVRRLPMRTMRPQMVSTSRHQDRAPGLPEMQESLLERSKEKEDLDLLEKLLATYTAKS